MQTCMGKGLHFRGSFTLLLLSVSAVLSRQGDVRGNKTGFNDCLQGQEVHDLSARDVELLRRCSSRSGVAISDVV